MQALKRSAPEESVESPFIVSNGWLVIQKDVSIRLSSICGIDTATRFPGVIIRTLDHHEYRLTSHSQNSPSYTPGTWNSPSANNPVTELMIKQPFFAKTLMDQITAESGNNPFGVLKKK